ncbi:MAG: biotin/lipoyl-containing protein [Candidatus Promineifilaceae bacterium]|nr:biotin/lipoyl-containing protein [Candidatus Promineifilaceae bacterium]
MKYMSTVNGREYVIQIDEAGQITVDGEAYAVDFEVLSEGGILSLLINNHSLEAIVEERDDHWEVLIHGELYSVSVQDERAYRLAKARGATTLVTGEVSIKSPMPGTIISVVVEPGQEVSKGDKIVILESMKMENELRAPRDGVVKAINVKAGANVEKDQILAVIGDGELVS